jgi:mediator of replication checkpoint protein 1
MRRALLADEKIGKIAQNPKQQAFFKAIEDHDDVDGFDYIDDEPIAVLDTQQDNDQEEGEAQNLASEPSLKRKASDMVAVTSSGKENVPPEGGRGSSDSSFKRPRLADTREQLSFLIDDSDSIIPDSQPYVSDDEADGEDYRFTFTRTDTTTSTDSNGSKTSVVNRLIRAQITEDDPSRPLAFQTSVVKAASSFKIPSLLRRATTLSNTSESSSTKSKSSVQQEKSIRLGGSKKSNIHYQAYEAERRRTVEAAEQKRKAQLKKTVMSTKGRTIMGLIQSNKNGFE